MMFFYHKGNKATSIPSQCCALPFTLNGDVHHKCTVNQAVSNDPGCYHTNGHWVKCQQPDGTFYSCLQYGMYTNFTVIHN